MRPISYARHQFPPDLIRHAVWLYLRFTLSFRDVEDLLAERGIEVSYETIRRWVLKFGPNTRADEAYAASSSIARTGSTEPAIVAVAYGITARGPAVTNGVALLALVAVPYQPAIGPRERRLGWAQHHKG